MAICEIKCDKCRNIHNYDCSRLDWKRVESVKRNMGIESRYQAVIEETCSCGQSMCITFDCWEYPVGVKNTSDVKVTGAQIVKNECASCPDFSS